MCNDLEKNVRNKKISPKQRTCYKINDRALRLCQQEPARALGNPSCPDAIMVFAEAYSSHRRKKCYPLNNEHYVILVKHVPPFKNEAQIALFQDPVRTAQKTLFTSVIKTNHFMSYGAEVAVCSQINTKHINALLTERTIVEC